MRSNQWCVTELRKRLIAQQQEYVDKGLEHASFAESNEAFRNTWMYHREIVLSLIPGTLRKGGAKVLDVGGGKGRMSTLLSGLGFDCTLVDPLYLETDALNTDGRPLIPLLEQYCTEKGVDVIACDSRREGLPFPDKSFDLVIFTEVLEHLRGSPKSLIVDMQRCLRSGGYLILTTPNIASYSKRVQFLMGHSLHADIRTFYQLGADCQQPEYTGHHREYTLSEVCYMLSEADFDVLEARTEDYRSGLTAIQTFRKAASRVGFSRGGPLFGFGDALLCFGEYFCKKRSREMKDFIVILARK